MASILQYPLGADGVVTRVLECGMGDDAVILLHGLGARANRWQETLPALAEAAYHAYAFDFPGHGFASKGAEIVLSVPAFAKLTIAVLDALEIKRAFLIGTSLGGHVAATVACKIPDRIRGLVLVGTIGIAPMGREVGNAIRQSVRQTDRASIERKFASVFADPSRLSPAMIEEEWRVNNSPGARESFTILGDYFAERADLDAVGQELSALLERVPALLVWGSRDKVVPIEIGRRSSEILKGTDLAVIEGVGHAPYLEEPAAFAQTVVPRLNRWRGGSLG
jgi:pimeloyl-ACP methyl ester carboxylesterase